MNQKIAVGVLKKLGYENVDVAENGLEVIDKLDQGSVYDVILVRSPFTAKSNTQLTSLDQAANPPFIVFSRWMFQCQ